MKKEEDISWAQRAADEARERENPARPSRRVEHAVCHVRDHHADTEEGEPPESRVPVRRVPVDGERKDYRPDQMVSNIKAVSPWLWNVFVKNQVGGPGPINRPEIKLSDPGGVDFAKMFEGLRAINYSGYVTIAHRVERAIRVGRPAAQQCHSFLKSFISPVAAKS